jgi:hypothetical protein
MKQMIYHSSNEHKVQHTSHSSRTTHNMMQFNNDTQHMVQIDTKCNTQFAYHKCISHFRIFQRRARRTKRARAAAVVLPASVAPLEFGAWGGGAMEAAAAATSGVE